MRCYSYCKARAAMLLLVLTTMLTCHLSPLVDARPLRSLQEIEIGPEAPEAKNLAEKDENGCRQINAAGDLECDDVQTVLETEDESVTDTQIITVIVVSVIGVVVVLSTIIIVCTLMNHQKSLNEKKHLGIQLQRQITETQKRIERRDTLLKKQSMRSQKSLKRQNSSSNSSFESEKISSEESSSSEANQIETKMKPFAVDSESDSLSSYPQRNIELHQKPQQPIKQNAKNMESSFMSYDRNTVQSAPTNVTQPQKKRSFKSTKERIAAEKRSQETISPIDEIADSMMEVGIYIGKDGVEDMTR